MHTAESNRLLSIRNWSVDCERLGQYAIKKKHTHTLTQQNLIKNKNEIKMNKNY